MSLNLGSPELHARFGEICKLVSAQRRGLTMVQLRDAHALARQLEESGDTPKGGDTRTDRVEELCMALGIDVEAVS